MHFFRSTVHEGELPNKIIYPIHSDTFQLREHILKLILFEQGAYLFYELHKNYKIIEVPLDSSQNVPYLRHQTFNHILCW